MALQSLLSQSKMLTVEEIKKRLRKLNAASFHEEEICPKCEEKGIPRYHLNIHKGRKRIVLEYLNRNKIPSLAKNYKTDKFIKLYPRCYIGELVSQAEVYNDMIHAGESE
jgi:hypothetical protein